MAKQRIYVPAKTYNPGKTVFFSKKREDELMIPLFSKRDPVETILSNKARVWTFGNISQMR
jgi:hypothetical protein